MEAAIRSFSNERIREITGEVLYKYPGLEFVVRKMSGWPKEFGFDKLKELVELIALEVELKEGGESRYAWAAGYAANPVGFITILLECNILWIKLSRTDEAKPFDPLNPAEVTSERYFAVHPMFAPGLGLVGA